MEKKKVSFFEIAFEAKTFAPSFANAKEGAFWQEEFKKGRSKAFNLITEHCNIKTVIRGEDSELVICLVVGKGMQYFIPEIKKIAQKSGFKTVRFHVQNRAIMRLYQSSLKDENIKEIERVYQVVI